MNKKSKKAIVLWVTSLFLVVSWYAMTEAITYAQAIPEKLYSDEKTRFPDLKFPIPQDRTEREYLGLSGKNTFRVGDINAEIVIIEVFSFYCPTCQAQATRVNELYNKIQADPNLRNTVKMIGIAATNSPFEAKSFKESHRVPFPVFSDEDEEIAVALNIKYTPTFIGVRVNGKGLQEQFYWRPGAFTDPSQFLQEILKTSGTGLTKGN
ncbi:MAG: putative thioredoxin [Deltaproteobacteria bacterium]|nr:putative thioredoxin [Deltaproteobacteria bacterium]